MPVTMSNSSDTPITPPAERLGTAPLVRRPLQLSGRAVLLATDGSPSAVSAARIAHALAAQYHAQVHVVSVIDARSVPIPPPLDIALAMGDAVGGAGLHLEQEAAVRAELSGALGEPVAWPVRIMLGSPSASIVREAQRVGAVLIIVGLRRHGRLDRAVNDETSLNVMRTAACPVLGVVAEQTDLPRRILAALDFSEGSLIAMRAGRAVAGPAARLVLAYVQPMNGFLADEGEATIHELGVQAGFEQLERDVASEGITFDRVVLHRAPSQSVGQALLECADEANCDLITAGSVQHSRVDRWMVGSVSTEMVRDGRRSVLIVPPRRQD
jgi:nucleotide-binding universal stress UspA family protein